MAEIEKVSLTCPHCGKNFNCKVPSAPGNYQVTCINPECKAKIKLTYPLSTDEKPLEPKNEPQYGLLENGNYRFRCKNESCHQSVLVPANMVKIGHNKIKCPKCQTIHEFDIEPTETDLLKCQTADCDGILTKPDGEDGVYSLRCEKCNQEYSLIVEHGKVVKVMMKTPEPIKPKKQFPMKLVVGHFLGKKEYSLSKGRHYIGRSDQVQNSDFAINDKYASCRSVRIDVNEIGGNLVYKLTVERATNPVYHNSHELAVDDIVYLSYGDTLKLGKTLIKVQKIKT